ncbi:MAG: undecaprenyl-diphosphate phosphatase [Firmicutes bacterium]|nr:undecaprenyl-diphosphate phosphatase [Bacillota bacterium]
MVTFLYDLLKTVILGIVQGITEWLPVSSTGHLILFSTFFPLAPQQFFDVFKVVIQFGSILAVLVLYFQKLWPWMPNNSAKKVMQSLNLWAKVIVGVLPALVFGLLLDDLIDSVLSTPFVIAVTLIGYGIIFLIVEKNPKTPTITSVNQLDYMTSLKIGFFQCLALIPGTSRSGATILGGLFCGCTRKVSSEFSFFLAIPVMAGASALKVFKYVRNYGFFSFSQIILLLLGTAIAFVVSLVAIRRLLQYVRTHDFTIFGKYRIVLGIIVLIFFYVI